MKFAIRYSPVNRVFLTVIGLGPRRAWVEVGPDEVRVRMGYAFRGTIARAAIAGVTQVERIPWGWGVGVHGGFGRWVVNGTLRGIVNLTIEPPARGRVLGVGVKLRALWVSLEDPDGFQAAIAR